VGTRPKVSRQSASTVALDIKLPPLAPPPSEVRIGLAHVNAMVPHLNHSDIMRI
jgi:hypothetical protein